MNALENRIIAALRGKKKPPLTLRQLAKQAGVKKNQKAAFSQALDSLLNQNKIIRYKDTYLLAETAALIPAEIVKVNATFGFAKPAEGDRDVFIPGRLLLGAMPGDAVLIRQKLSSGELPEGEVVQVTREAGQKFSGVARISEQECVIVPDSYVKFPIRLHRRKLAGAKDGDKILAVLDSRGARHAEHIARVLECFGDADSARACCRAVLAAGDIDPQFPPEALEQARAVAAGSGIHPKELAARLDLREERIFTIDGADSKDLDDAVSLKKTASGWELGVHIADVSHYVTHQSPLDTAAFSRGTSVYYADSVVPMLPTELSNDVCSLNPGEDRLAFSALLGLDGEGVLQSWRFVKSVIRSRVKGIYTEVNAILDGTADAALLQKYDGLLDGIAEMARLAEVLTKNRYARGGMDLDTVESKIVVGPDGQAKEILARERGASERIIEEFMLCANEAAASLALEEAIPFVYRVHELPAPDKLAKLYEILDRLGIKAKRPKGGIQAAHLAQILNQAKGTEVERVIGTMLLRSMAKAKYSDRNIGHFGLSLKNYAHFTSPIRRYPDLTIHRILSAYVTGMRKDNIKKRYGSFAADAAARSTDREIAAMTAERSCEDCYKAEYMRQFVGECYDGIITGTTAFGIYVQLENTVEGLCALNSFPAGDWEFDGSIAYADRLSGKRMRLGDAVRVRVLAAHVSAGQVDFALV